LKQNKIIYRKPFLFRRFLMFALKYKDKTFLNFISKRGLKESNGLKEFIKDNYKIANQIQKTPIKLEVNNRSAFFNNESDALLNYEHNRNTKLCKEKPTLEKGVYLSKKLKSIHQAIEVSQLTHKVSKLEEERTKCSSDFQNNFKQSIIRFDDKTIRQDTKRVKQLSITAEKDIERNKDRSIAQQKLETTANFSVQYELEKIKEMLIEEDKAERSNFLRNYITILKKYSLDKNFLKSVIDFPLVSKEIILKHPDFFDASEIQILNQSLFSHMLNVDTTQNKRLNIPTVARILDLCKSNRANEQLLVWKLEKIKIYGLNGFKNYRKKLLQRGEIFHRFIESQLRKKEFNESTLEINMQSINAFKSFLQSEFKDALLIESVVSHKNLFYTGRIDSLIYYKNRLCLVDWKTSDKDKTNLKDFYDNPIQIVAYMGAFLNDPTYQELRTKHSVENGLIVHMNQKTGKIDVHLINYQQAELYWYEWLKYLKKFWFLVIKEQKKIIKN